MRSLQSNRTGCAEIAAVATTSGATVIITGSILIEPYRSLLLSLILYKSYLPRNQSLSKSSWVLLPIRAPTPASLSPSKLLMGRLH